MTNPIGVQEAKAAAEAPPTPQLGTPVEVAEFMHTTVASLAQDRYLGRGLPYIKLGRRVLYRWADVQSYLDANTVNPGAA